MSVNAGDWGLSTQDAQVALGLGSLQRWMKNGKHEGLGDGEAGSASGSSTSTSSESESGVALDVQDDGISDEREDNAVPGDMAFAEEVDMAEVREGYADSDEEWDEVAEAVREDDSDDDGQEVKLEEEEIQIPAKRKREV